MFKKTITTVQNLNKSARPILGVTIILKNFFSIFPKHGELALANQNTSNIYQKEIKLKPYNGIYTKLATPTISSWLALL